MCVCVCVFVCMCVCVCVCVCVEDVTMHLSIFVCICNKTGPFSFLSPFRKRRHKLRWCSVVIIMSLCVPCSAPRRFVNGKQNNREQRGTVRNARCYRKVVLISTVFVFVSRKYSSAKQTGKCFRFMFT